MDKQGLMKGFLTGLLVLPILLAGCASERTTAFQALTNHDYKTALAEYKELAAKGDYVADLKLSYMYNAGLGVDIDGAEAERWLEKAAIDGSD